MKTYKPLIALIVLVSGLPAGLTAITTPVDIEERWGECRPDIGSSACSFFALVPDGALPSAGSLPGANFAGTIHLELREVWSYTSTQWVCEVVGPAHACVWIPQVPGAIAPVVAGWVDVTAVASSPGEWEALISTFDP